MNIYTGYETTAKKLMSGLWLYRGFMIARFGKQNGNGLYQEDPKYYWIIFGIYNQKFPQLGYARMHIDKIGGFLCLT